MSPAMRLLITAGPTWEKIDAVRYIGNRSSGKVGLSIAAAGRSAGHDVTMLLGPGVPAGDLPDGRVERFESAGDLLARLEQLFDDQKVVVMAAAVADYRPAEVIEGKRPREGGGQWSIQLTPTPDLTATIAPRKKPHQRIVAFALEAPETLEQRAGAKLVRKGADAIIANPLQTMGADDIHPLWMTADGGREEPGAMSKAQFGAWVIEKVERLFE